MKELVHALNKQFEVGHKMCGAGGGGCFVLTHSNVERSSLQPLIEDHSMEVLEYQIANEFRPC